MFFSKEDRNRGDYLMNQFSTGMMVLKLTEGKIFFVEFCNEALAQILDYEYEELKHILSYDVKQILYPADYSKVISSILATPVDDSFAGSFRMVKKSGNVFWVLGHCHVIVNEGNTFVFLTVNNIEEYVIHQNKLDTVGTDWFDVINSIPVGIFIFSKDTNDRISVITINDTLVDFASKVGKAMDGKVRTWTKEKLSFLLGQNLYAFCVDEDAHQISDMLTTSEGKGFSDCTFRLRGSTDEKAVYIFCSCNSNMGPDGNRIYYVLYQDVTEDELRKKELEANHQALMNLSLYDSLTGVKNRNYYNKMVEQFKEQRHYNVGIVFADVNGLKHVNDSIGHLQGDDLIRHFSHILTETFGIDNVYRISGDEFVVIIWDIERDHFARIMHHIRDMVHEANDIASIGAIWKENVSDIRRRVLQAEDLMYLEKKKFYADNITLSSKHRDKLLAAVIGDLQSNRYKMYLQPKAYVSDTRVTGAEALVRYIGKDGRVVAPYEFISNLEQEKLISYVDFFMLEETCKLLGDLKRQGNESFVISVNASRVTMAEVDYIERVLEIVDRYDINRWQLEFEITESSQTMDKMRLEDDVRKLHELGFRVSLDDVGTDYSSFPMLILDGIDVVKLDRSFIIKLGTPKVDTLISHIIKLSHELGLFVIAEGVETDEVRQSLEEKGCDMYQGYLLSKPIPTEAFVEKYL